MNRETKFRGKDLATGKWVYGDLLHSITSCRIVNYTETEENGAKRADYHCYDIKPDTRGQYIGLIDINGTEIYDGDILRVRGFNTEGEIEEWLVIVGQYGEIAYNIADSDYSLLVWIKDFVEYEIIGNVHDNPDLLKGK